MSVKELLLKEEFESKHNVTIQYLDWREIENEYGLEDDEIEAAVVNNHKQILPQVLMVIEQNDSPNIYIFHAKSHNYIEEEFLQAIEEGHGVNIKFSKILKKIKDQYVSKICSLKKHEFIHLSDNDEEFDQFIIKIKNEIIKDFIANLSEVEKKELEMNYDYEDFIRDDYYFWDRDKFETIREENE